MVKPQLNPQLYLSDKARWQAVKRETPASMAILSWPSQPRAILRSFGNSDKIILEAAKATQTKSPMLITNG
ncbi:hypothetical protein HH682_01620 [Rosenbergiella sp. S61]|uniref:Uncharacterized protein n=1 Tax=Rosenbergiella gaditana TaxID=2726987 RepID=A0ABS5ST22_9GAMM|nr:hypothetical protein [Rosenbergiella gaditana]MBT0723157.1 hypothetical protein [Rosenbergiella gaditana]